MGKNMKKINIGIVGAGWRTEFFMKVASLTHYNIKGVVVRDIKKYQQFSEKWSVKLYGSVELMLDDKEIDFVIISVPSLAVREVLGAIQKFKIPVLLETPVGRTIEAVEDMLTKYGDYPIQVAEQYHLQPMHTVREKLIHEGVIGKPYHAYISVCHGYHGVSLMRKFLGVNTPEYQVVSFAKKEGLKNKALRYGRKSEDYYGEHVSAYIDFGEVTGIYDFTEGQYFSPIRKSHIIIKGDNGEMTNNKIVFYEDDKSVCGEIKRHMNGIGGNLNNLGLDYISFNGKVMWTNPYKEISLSEEELAIAITLDKMTEYVKEGKAFYSLKEASYDALVSIAIVESLQNKA